ncbi:cilia- and flagella-associated protein 298 [Nilaparvata lugens]|uniref:cilia- and flagella-associated protein 298 n=1 Tax=Nilaparvata lugens TaxID=108931 RepID=UPI00193CCF4F|nr:cilia- and flagella-associated protein 298 [Nilaparvata lugens]
MVKVLVKKGDETQFLYETSVGTDNVELTQQITYIYNGRLKVSRICSELEELSKHGTMLPPDMMGLTDEQIEELKLKDEWGERCEPSGGCTDNKDPMGRRNGKQPSEHMQQLINKSVTDVKEMLSKKKADNGICMTLKTVQEALEILRGTVMIIYPMNLPPHDVIRQEFENTEDLSGTQASLDVIDVASAQLWFSGKELVRNKKLCNFVGNNYTPSRANISGTVGRITKFH